MNGTSSKSELIASGVCPEAPDRDFDIEGQIGEHYLEPILHDTQYGVHKVKTNTQQHEDGPTSDHGLHSDGN